MTGFSDTPEDRPDSWAVAEWRVDPWTTYQPKVGQPHRDYEFRLLLSDVLRNCRTDARYDLHRRHRARQKAVRAVYRRRRWKRGGGIALMALIGLSPLLAVIIGEAIRRIV